MPESLKSTTRRIFSGALLLGLLSAGSPARAAIDGPVFPTPVPIDLTVTEILPNPDGERLGRPGGTLSDYVIDNPGDLGLFDVLVWGQTAADSDFPYAVALAWDGEITSSTDEVMTFQPGLSNLAGGVAVWRGTVPGRATRFKLTVTDSSNAPIPLLLGPDAENLPRVDLTDLPLDATYRVRMEMQVQRGCAGQVEFAESISWAAALDEFDCATGLSQEGLSRMSVSSGFFFERTATSVDLSGVLNGIALLEGKADALEVKADALEVKADSHATETNSRHDALSAATQNVSFAVQVLESKLDQIPQSINGVINDLSEIKQIVQGLPDLCAALILQGIDPTPVPLPSCNIPQQFIPLLLELAGPTRGVLAENIAVLESKADALESKADALQTSVDNNHTATTLALTSLESKADALEGKADALQTSVGNNHTSTTLALTSLESKTDALESKADALESKADALQASVDDLVDSAKLDINVVESNRLSANWQSFVVLITRNGQPVDAAITGVDALRDAGGVLDASAAEFEAIGPDSGVSLGVLNLSVNTGRGNNSVKLFVIKATYTDPNTNKEHHGTKLVSNKETNH